MVRHAAMAAAPFEHRYGERCAANHRAMEKRAAARLAREEGRIRQATDRKACAWQEEAGAEEAEERAAKDRDEENVDKTEAEQDRRPNEKYPK